MAGLPKIKNFVTTRFFYWFGIRSSRAVVLLKGGKACDFVLEESNENVAAERQLWIVITKRLFAQIESVPTTSGVVPKGRS